MAPKKQRKNEAEKLEAEIILPNKPVSPTKRVTRSATRRQEEEPQPIPEPVPAPVRRAPRRKTEAKRKAAAKPRRKVQPRRRAVEPSSDEKISVFLNNPPSVESTPEPPTPEPILELIPEPSPEPRRSARGIVISEGGSTGRARSKAHAESSQTPNVYIEFCTRVKKFAIKADELEQALEESNLNVKVVRNPNDGQARKGCFEVRMEEEEGKRALETHLDITRPYAELQQIDVESVVRAIRKAVRSGKKKAAG